ncbi:xanthine dehydrogenase accessory protein XdhC [Marinomonas mediterranea]|jgi:xanthine dehydrogenase accessory protein XdhC|uniref:Xanthine dehydrogenase accessory protein XdhC n=1 Tax=Marinomonas mediterranea (strain ATCC 700492 / JCM 21426 / NBRC 103028 / MMB-1) TaxID=717774 RepID=F2K0M2_MARM1|nr:xanthine dehydrogenase accessory protein XdhC [Marinomonas mediterranea]ADZ91006.1 xanthine dehydrogenase accessory protein XdhC [Marinomonas mediterranea MMB-1]WCN09043.1 xanthine dehydrogenase accessory protein XdhC [Marinomonas mediterranea]WCN13075.1 xanthine dehydrogenase accessory protein XdhC [Marinomonas mediterranea]WCN17145.1 xanthine dehydrogenase accessory protein XdhC [Marinomonas mediterranea MMB-1]
MNTDWIQEAARLEASGIDFIMVSVLNIKGSTPREVGAKMLVSQHGLFGTIGGGHLEYKAIEHARAQLSSNIEGITTEDFPLGATLGQCCGGFVTVLYESAIHSVRHIAIYGAGHVGKAVVHCLGNIPARISWVDSRENEYPTEVPTNTTKRLYDLPVDSVADMPKDTYFLILTHNHQLDLELVETILKRNDAKFLGVIGSKTKSARFKHRLKAKGFSNQQINTMQCPVGDPDIISKQPGEIAISIAASILKVPFRSEKSTTKQSKDTTKQDLSNIQTEANS